MSTRTISPRQSIRTNQQGMVSILVTMILMIVMSLIVLGFAQNSRRNQRETLDRQLSTQAFYAAESGVNDARDIISKVTGAPSAKTSCTDAGTGGVYQSLIDNSTIDATHNVSYSCVLINPAPTELDYPIDTTGTLIPLFSGNGASFGNIQLSWSANNNATPTVGCPTQYVSGNSIFTPTSNWTCGYGVVRLDIVPVSGTLTTSTLQTNDRTVWAIPVKTAGTNNYNVNADGNDVVGVKCTDASCDLAITGVPGGQYYLRAVSLYQGATLKITSPLGLAGAQIMVDSTGRAQDVLRRIQVRVPIKNTSSKNLLPDNALQSTDSICKRFATMQGYYSNNAGVAGNNALCK
ncbi:MAG: pilus assembly PilX family protein [Candidatus Saccharibacteria bacterium]